MYKIFRDEMTYLKNSSIILIMWAIFLCSFQLRIYNLEIILPLIGIILLTMGVWKLRNQNKNFKIALGVSYFEILLHITSFIVLYCSNIKNKDDASLFFAIIGTIAMLTIFYNAFNGMSKIAYNANREAISNSLKNCIWLYFGANLLLLVALVIPYLIIITLINYVFIIIVILCKLYTFKHINYSIKEECVNLKFGLSLVLILAVFSVSFYSILKITNAPKVSAEIYNKNDAFVENISDIKEKMIKYGFDEEVLNDLSNTTIKKYSDIIRINKIEKIQDIDGGKLLHRIYIGTLEDNKIIFLTYYKWIKNPKHGFVDLVGTGLNNEAFIYLNDFKVQKVALYDKSENSTARTYKSKVFDADYFLSLSMKFRVFSNYKNQRGYICFECIKANSAPFSYNIINQYIHQNSLYNIPYKDIYDVYTPYTIHSPSSYKLFDVSSLYIFQDTEK